MSKFPKSDIKNLVRTLVVDPLLKKASDIASNSISSYIAAKSSAPDDGLAKPIMATLLPPSMVIGSAIERSFVTSMGWRMDTILTRIAEEYYDFSAGGKERYVKISGQLPAKTITTIDRLISEMARSNNKQAPNHAAEEKAIIESFQDSPDDLHKVSGIRVDVFFVDKESETEFALESKTQKADKGQLKDAKLDALRLIALKAFHNSKINYENAKGEKIITGKTSAL